MSVLSKDMVCGLFGSLGDTVFQLYPTATFYGAGEVFTQLAEQGLRNKGRQAGVAVRLQRLEGLIHGVSPRAACQARYSSALTPSRMRSQR